MGDIIRYDDWDAPVVWFGHRAYLMPSLRSEYVRYFANAEHSTAWWELFDDGYVVASCLRYLATIEDLVAEDR